MPTYPYRARAVQKYKTPPGQQPAFAFAPGADLTVLSAADDDGDWLEGELATTGDKGIFPATFVEAVADDVPASSAEHDREAPVEVSPAQDTVDATLMDNANVVEGSEPTPAAVNLKPDEVTSAEPTSAAAQADESTARSPTSPVEQPTLEDVVPAAAAPAPAAPAAGSTSAPPAAAAKATPPPPAKKPNALASRIAAFQAAAEAQKSDVPPVPRAKPREWKPRPAADAPAPAPATAPAAAAAPTSPAAAPSAPMPDIVRSTSTDEAAGGAAQDFSAQDAADSISRGGGSLRDRIKLLQGGGGGSGGVRVDAPPPPGQAPKPKPWRRAEPEPEPESAGAEGGASEARELDDTVVKDDKPGEDETTAQSPGAEVPGFEPAEASPDAPRSVVGDEPQAAAEAFVKTPMDTANVVEGGESTSAEATTDQDGAARAPEPAVEQPSLDDVTPAGSRAPAPAEHDASAPVEEDDEEAKRAAVAQRMAGLGGQRMGMPALPKRAAGPRAARKVKSPAVETPPPALSPEPAPASAPAVKEEQAPKEDVLASMGGASSLLSQGDGDDDDERTKAPVDDDEFETPAPPVRAPPPAAEVKNEVEHPVEIDEPELAADEAPLEVDDYVQHDERAEEERPTIAEEAVAALPDTAAADDGASLSPSALRPPVPPPFVRQPTDEPRPGPPTAEVPTSGLTRREPPPPSRSMDPPALASGAETIVDEPRPTAHAPEGETAPPPPPTRGRPPVPQTQSSATDEPSESATPQHPPVPTHPPPVGAERVTTAAEDRIIASMPEIVTPPEEAFDESTASPLVDAPSTSQIAESRAEKGHEPADMAQPVWGKVEGTQTPAAVEKADPLVPGAPPPPAMLKAALSRAQAEGEGGDEREEAQEPQQHEEEEEEEKEDEDPEVARRRALAARMAKLGGQGMMPMFGGFGGPPPGGAPKKKAPVKKPTNELAEEGQLKPAGLESRPVESRSGSDEAVPAHPPRRIGGMPAGGFALPGIAQARPPPPPPPADAEPEPEQDESHPLAEDAASLKAKSDAATDEAFERHSASSDGDRLEARDEVEAAGEELDDDEEEQAPPPLPTSRPPTMPPSRSVPVPAADDDRDEANVQEEQQQHVDEPESFAHDEQGYEQDQEEEGDSAMPPPPPPPRPAGGHQASLPLSPSHDSPSSPPMRAPPSPRMSSDLARTATQSSRRSSAFAGAPISPRQSFGDYPSAQQQQHGDVSSSAPIRANLDSLLQWSASLGAQVFAAAHVKQSDKAARGLSDRDLIEFCLGRATDPMPPSGGRYGAVVYDAMVEQGKKAATVSENDEPRAGDIVSMHAKFKHALSSKTVGSAQAPHVAVVAAWDDKKGKLRVLEVDPKSGTMAEGSYKVEDMRAGQLTVYRVAPRDYA
ncbi:hypothetical protein JCM9279_003817 [Rhodotorula babjevae]